MGTALQDFAMFQSLTGPSIYNDRNRITNEAVSRSHIFPKLFEGRTDKTTFRGGSEIQDRIQFENKATASNVNAMVTRSYQHRQAMTSVSVPWRFTEDYMAWTDKEIELNCGDQSMTRAFRDTKFKELKYSFEQRLWTSIFEFIDDTILRVPTGTYGPAAMESDKGLDQMSLFAMINEETNGLYTGWTTKQGIAPATESKWRPQAQTYAASSFATDDGSGLFNGFDELSEDVKFIAPKRERQYFEGFNPNRQFIITSRKGLSNYRTAARSVQELFVSASRQDPAFPNVTYNGAELLTPDRMTDNTAWDDGAQNEAGASVPHPRYLWINGDYTIPIFHNSYYFRKDEPMRNISQPDTWVQRIEIWWNILYLSLQRQGILSPV